MKYYYVYNLYDKDGDMYEDCLLVFIDKIQNRKDFEIYHKATHENSAALTQYFSEWLDTLGVSESDYTKWLELIK